MSLTTELVLSRKEAAKSLGICLTVFDRLKIPNIRVGRRILYRREVLENWLCEAEQKQLSLECAKQGA